MSHAAITSVDAKWTPNKRSKSLLVSIKSPYELSENLAPIWSLSGTESVQKQGDTSVAAQTP